MVFRISNLLGLIFGFVAIFGAFFLEGGAINSIFLFPPILIVFGGTFAAVFIGFGWEKFRLILPLAKLAYSSTDYNYKKIIYGFTEISQIVRMQGLLEIEKNIDKVVYQFPQKLIKHIMDGADGELLEDIAIIEIKATENRHNENILMFAKMGGYAPTMGIIGTVMGLIMTLANAGNEPEILIRSIASAFIATFWGIVSANFLWLPIADKLRQINIKEKLMMEISLEGALAIQCGEIPTLVKSRLMSLLPKSEQDLRKVDLTTQNQIV